MSINLLSLGYLFFYEGIEKQRYIIFLLFRKLTKIAFWLYIAYVIIWTIYFQSDVCEWKLTRFVKEVKTKDYNWIVKEVKTKDFTKTGKIAGNSG